MLASNSPACGHAAALEFVTSGHVDGGDADVAIGIRP
jgi:hypothetical protein